MPSSLHFSFFVVFFSLVDSSDQGGGKLSTIGVAAAIAGPMCFICGLIMLFICWHQKRQLKQQEHFNEAEAALKPLEVDEAVIPSGQTLKELMDMSTGKSSQYKTAGFESSKHTCYPGTLLINYGSFIFTATFCLDKWPFFVFLHRAKNFRSSAQPRCVLSYLGRVDFQKHLSYGTSRVC